MIFLLFFMHPNNYFHCWNYLNRSSPKPRMMVCGSPPSQSPAPSMVVTPTPEPTDDQDSELHTFREAIALSGMKKKEIFSH